MTHPGAGSNKSFIPKSIVRDTCRACGGILETLWDLGTPRVVGFPEFGGELPPKAPLVLTMCMNQACSLVQLRHTFPPEHLFREYWYRSGTNESMVQALNDIVIQARRRCPVGPGDVVIDIGANDGTLLSMYDEHGEPHPIRIGIDPATNVQDELRTRCEFAVCDFFPCGWQEKAKIITAIAMAYDLEDPNAFFSEVKELLHPNGLFVMQLGYAGTLIYSNAFDSICHEHLEYYSVKSLYSILERAGLTIQEIEFNQINGGSLRCYIRHAGTTGHSRQHAKVMEAISEEGNGAGRRERYLWLKERVVKLRSQLLDIVERSRGAGVSVDVYGASTKGLTLMQFYGLDFTQIRWAVDRNPIKFGRQYGGTGIPVVAEEKWRADQEESLAIVLPWHFRAAFLERERGSGRQFLFPLPKVEIIHA